VLLHNRNIIVHLNFQKFMQDNIHYLA
jgi:hypothetical protein